MNEIPLDLSDHADEAALNPVQSALANEDLEGPVIILIPYDAESSAVGGGLLSLQTCFNVLLPVTLLNFRRRHRLLSTFL